MIAYTWPYCGSCGKLLRKPWRSKRQNQKRKYCTHSCVPASTRAANGRKARAKGVARARLRLYISEVKRLRALKHLTGDELLASFAAVGSRSYDRGYSACEAKWRRQQQESTVYPIITDRSEVA